MTVSGLSVGKSYRCVVAARNSVGLGAASKPSAIVVPLANPPKALPVPPKLIYARAEVKSARVAFVAIEASGGTRVTRYMASCTSSNGGNPNKQQRSISPITVNHLAAGKTYTCRVASRNPAGWGKFSPPSKPLITLGHAVKPGKPTAVAAKAGVRSVTVSFKQPTSDGGVPIVRYQVTCTFEERRDHRDPQRYEVAGQGREPLRREDVHVHRGREERGRVRSHRRRRRTRL